MGGGLVVLPDGLIHLLQDIADDLQNAAGIPGFQAEEEEVRRAAGDKADPHVLACTTRMSF